MAFIVKTTAPAPLSAPPLGTYLGLTKTQVIEQADARTERRAGTQLNLMAEFSNALREFCQEYRFYWRNRSVNINTVPGFSLYDLNAYVSDPGEIRGVRYIKADGTSVRLDPVFKTDEIDELEESTETGEPNTYSIDGSYSQLKIFPKPNGIYKIKVFYRSVPNVAIDDQSDQIPIVPPQHHVAIQKCIEKNVLEFLFGSESPRYVTATQMYEKFLDKAVKESRDFAYFHRTEEPGENEPNAIRSTH